MSAKTPADLTKRVSHFSNIDVATAEKSLGQIRLCKSMSGPIQENGRTSVISVEIDSPPKAI